MWSIQVSLDEFVTERGERREEAASDVNMAVSVPFQVNYDEFMRGMKYLGINLPSHILQSFFGFVDKSGDGEIVTMLPFACVSTAFRLRNGTAFSLASPLPFACVSTARSSLRRRLSSRPLSSGLFGVCGRDSRGPRWQPRQGEGDHGRHGAHGRGAGGFHGHHGKEAPRPKPNLPDKRRARRRQVFRARKIPRT